jgi:arsenate reductase
VARPHRVLFVCTHNSARSQIAEALLRSLGGDAFEVESAGSEPSGRVHPLALRMIAELGGDPARHRSKGLDEALAREWDLVVTVCDDARDACPVLPPGTTTAHWGMTDPSRAGGSEAERLAAFRETTRGLEDRIRSLVSQRNGVTR